MLIISYFATELFEILEMNQIQFNVIHTGKSLYRSASLRLGITVPKALFGKGPFTWTKVFFLTKLDLRADIIWMVSHNAIEIGNAWVALSL